MTRAAAEEEYRLPDAPRVGTSIRTALIDFYFNSWRLVPANVIWGLGLVLVVGLVFAWPFGSLLLLVLLGLPTAGIYRLAGNIVRDEPVAFSDALAWRQFARPCLVVSAGLVLITAVLSINIAIGLTSNEPIAWAMGTLAAWGLLATWAVALLLWPLMLDPLRAGQPLVRHIKLAATLLLVSPLQVAVLLIITAVVFAVSAVLFAALVAIAVAFVALVTARYVLPAADRLEGRKTKLVES